LWRLVEYTASTTDTTEVTWHTQYGQRILEGHEAALIRASLSTIADQLDEDLNLSNDDVPWDYGVRVFDALPLNSKFALLAEVGWALLRPTETCPRLTAVSEGTVAALFANVEQSIEMEIDMSEEGEVGFTTWRRLTLAVFEAGGDTDDLPDVYCEDMSEWSVLVECLADRVLWDADYGDADRFLDMPPEFAREMRDMFGIDEDYYLVIPPDPRDEELPAIRAKIRELCCG